MRRLAVSVVGGVAMVGCLTAPLESKGPVAGYVKLASGSAVIVRGDGELPARPGEGVYQDDALRTGAGGHLGVTLKDDTRVSLGPNSEIRLSRFQFSPAEGQLELVMRMIRGSAAFVAGRIAGLRPGAARIETPSTIVGVRGTHLAIRIEGS
jgi:hypothetical protein